MEKDLLVKENVYLVLKEYVEDIGFDANFNEIKEKIAFEMAMLFGVIVKNSKDEKVAEQSLSLFAEAAKNMTLVSLIKEALEGGNE